MYNQMFHYILGMGSLDIYFEPTKKQRLHSFLPLEGNFIQLIATLNDHIVVTSTTNDRHASLMQHQRSCDPSKQILPFDSYNKV